MVDALRLINYTIGYMNANLKVEVSIPELVDLLEELEAADEEAERLATNATVMRYEHLTRTKGK